MTSYNTGYNTCTFTLRSESIYSDSNVGSSGPSDLIKAKCKYIQEEIHMDWSQNARTVFVGGQRGHICASWFYPAHRDLSVSALITDQITCSNNLAFFFFFLFPDHQLSVFWTCRSCLYFPPNISTFRCLKPARPLLLLIFCCVNIIPHLSVQSQTILQFHSSWWCV